MKRLLILPILIVTVMAGACDARRPDDGTAGIASANGGSGATSTTSAAGDLRGWARCMRQHGQNVPDQPQSNNATGGNSIPGPPAGVDKNDQAWRTALNACRSLLPGSQTAAPPDAATLERLRQFAVCMREHGLDMTDPDTRTGNMQLRGRFNDLNRQQTNRDPAFKAAEDACKDKLPEESRNAPKKGVER